MATNNSIISIKSIYNSTQKEELSAKLNLQPNVWNKTFLLKYIVDIYLVFVSFIVWKTVQSFLLRKKEKGSPLLISRCFEGFEL